MSSKFLDLLSQLASGCRQPSHICNNNHECHNKGVSAFIEGPFLYGKERMVWQILCHDITVGQRNYFTTSVSLLYQLPLLAVLFITDNNNDYMKLSRSTEKYGKVVTLTHCDIHFPKNPFSTN